MKVVTSIPAANTSIRQGGFEKDCWAGIKTVGKDISANMFYLSL